MAALAATCGDSLVAEMTTTLLPVLLLLPEVSAVCALELTEKSMPVTPCSCSSASARFCMSGLAMMSLMAAISRSRL